MSGAAIPETIVVGLGKTGLSVVRHLQQQGVRCAVADTRDCPPGQEALRREFPDLELRTGPLDAQWLCQAAELIVSPGLSLAEPALQQAAAAGVRMRGDIDLLARAAQAPVIAITGSNAKSTVTTLVGLMAEAAGLRVAVGGNLGIPALELLDPQVELYVLELSSFQLETLHELRPQVAAFLNLSEDHMDRYGDLADYARAKQRIFMHAGQAVFNRDDPATRPQSATPAGSSFGCEPLDAAGCWGLLETPQGRWLARGLEPVLATAELKIRGQHNQLNALAALAIGEAAGLPQAAMLQALMDFAGLAHRCQWVRDHQGVSYFNDSKATNVGAALAAIEGLSADLPGKLVLIAGGDGKGADFLPLREPVRRYCRAVILLGRDAPRLEQALANSVPLLRVATLEEGVQQAARLAQAGDAVLLSPACASLDMFRNFEARGEAFVAAAGGLS